MTIKEAGTIMTTLRRMNQGWFSDDISKAFDVAIDVLDRQVPKKPIDNFFDKRCPSCNSIWGITKNEKFCPNCGQAIEWIESL